jgi:F-type H+-transporting ATPase subunit gamma
MAQTSREIKRRIASITNTQQITRAMEMVAAAKLRKVQDRVASTRPYFQRLTSSLSTVLGAVEQAGEELPEIAQRRDGDRHCLLVLSSDRGLAGGYNAAITRQAEAFLQEHPETELVIVGRKARDYFRRRNRTALAEFVGFGDEPNLRQAMDIGQIILDFYEHGMFDHFTILYTQFVSTLTQRAALRPVLPIPDEITEADRTGLDPVYIFEPSTKAVLEGLIPLYVNAAVYQSLMEAKASEFSARMNAMAQATDNADELIKELTQTYNRARQAQITKEIAEIVGGADALQS